MWMRLLFALFVATALFFGFQAYQVHRAFNALEDVPAGYASGPDDADITVVMFVQYSCQYCREAHPTIMEAAAQDGRVRIIPRPLPAQDSVENFNHGFLAYSAGLQGKFLDVHDAIMRDYRPVDEQYLYDLQDRVELYIEKLEAPEKQADIVGRLYENQRLFERVGGRATPLFIINKEYFYVPEGRMPTVDDFLKMFQDVRNAR